MKRAWISVLAWVICAAKWLVTNERWTPARRAMIVAFRSSSRPWSLICAMTAATRWCLWLLIARLALFMFSARSLIARPRQGMAAG